MKKITILFFAVLFGTFAFAQNEKYIAVMEKTIAQMIPQQSTEKWQACANAFERIANAESDQWLPAYYHAYCNMMMALNGYQQKTEFEPYLDKAQESLDKAAKLEPNNSEILSLQAYIYQGRIWPNPMVNGATYAPKSIATCDKAIELDPTNPRPYYLKGQNTYFTPEFFGGGAKNALPFLKEANEKFQTFVKASAIHPDWGMGANNYFLEKAEQDLK